MEPMFINQRLKPIARRLHLMQIASWTYELYRLIRQPHTHGSLVAIWQSNQLLLVETSYRRGYGLPGGAIQAGETARDAAIRELQEELGLAIESSWLQDPWTISIRQPGGLNTVTIFSLRWDQHLSDSIDVANRPRVVIDQLEIIATTWMSREEALDQHLPNHLRHYLETHSFRLRTREL